MLDISWRVWGIEFWPLVVGFTVVSTRLILTNEGQAHLFLAPFSQEYSSVSRVLKLPLLSLIVYLVVKTRNIRIRPPRSLVFLGAASYSVYLAHSPIQSILARISVSLQLELGILSFFAFISLGSLAAGIMYYMTVESRAQTWSKSFIQRR